MGNKTGKAKGHSIRRSSKRNVLSKKKTSGEKNTNDTLLSITVRSADTITEKSGKSDSPKDRPPVSEETLSKDELINQLCSGKKVSSTDFELLCVIGRGSFGKVMQVRHKETGKIYAMKTMRKGNIIAKNQVAHTKDEKHILQRIKHPFVVNLNYAFQTKDKLYMILDYVNGGELFWHLKKEGTFSEERSRFYAAEIASALFHLHENGIIYRDLKPENLLLDSEGHIVITDFGLSKEIKDAETHTFCGTPEYLAPEVLLGMGHSYAVDWWSLGTLVYEMMTGLPPFYSSDRTEMYNKILNHQLVFPHDMSDEACDFLLGMLEKDPEDRLTPLEIQEHPWFKGYEWESLIQKSLKPPWKPSVKGPMDMSQIDPELLNEAAVDTPNKRGPLDFSEGDEDLFAGFTYEGADTAGSVLEATVAGDSSKLSL